MRAGGVEEAKRHTVRESHVSALHTQAERGKSRRSKSGRVSIVAGPDKTLVDTAGVRGPCTDEV